MMLVDIVCDPYAC